MVIDRIVVTERTLEEIRAAIRWKDGSPPTEIAMELSPYVHREIARLARAGWSNTAIARHLSDRGIKTEKNRDWNVNSVGCQLRRHGGRFVSSASSIDSSDSSAASGLVAPRSRGA
jgi:hypothetical protein